MSSSGNEEYEIVTGTVKWFNGKKGFGFIVSDEDQNEIFVHRSGIVTKNSRQWWRSLIQGQKVEFIIVEGEKGPQAEEVTNPNGVPIEPPTKRKKPPSRRSGTSDTQQPRAQKEEKVDEIASLSYPYFEQDVPDNYILAERKKKSRNDELYPTEWVGLRTRKPGRTKFTFVQVAYAMLPEDNSPVKEYKVFLKGDDYEGTVFKRSDLVKLESEDPEDVNAGAVPEGAGHRHKRKLQHQSRPDQEEGRKWMKQVDIDSEILQDLLTHSNSHEQLKMYATLCFLAQQVVEKAMTAAVIFLIGSKVHNILYMHDLLERVEILKTKKISIDNFTELEAAANALKDYYLRTRYPNQWEHEDAIPADQYDPDTAKQACKHAFRVREKINMVIDKTL